MSSIGLWRSVLLQAFRDYLSYDPRKTSIDRYNDHLDLKKWFDTSNKDFCLVCELAGYEPAYVLERFIKINKKTFNRGSWLRHDQVYNS